MPVVPSGAGVAGAEAVSDGAEDGGEGSGEDGAGVAEDGSGEDAADVLGAAAGVTAGGAVASWRGLAGREPGRAAGTARWDGSPGRPDTPAAVLPPWPLAPPNAGLAAGAAGCRLPAWTAAYRTAPADSARTTTAIITVTATGCGRSGQVLMFSLTRQG